MRPSHLSATAGIALVASTAFADGVVVGHRFLTKRIDGGPEEVAADPVIPDQRALIVHRDGRETLVIETAFAGRGTEFAWVVPTPSVPTIAEETPDLFPELVDAARPDLVSRVPDFRVAALVAIAAILLARHAGARGRRVGTAFVAGFAALAALADGPGGGAALRAGDPVRLGPAAGPAVGVTMTPAEDPVVVRQREVVGAFETVTLSARDPHALVEWLGGHGYSVPAAMEGVAAAYVRDGWVFNAMRLHRDGDGSAAVRIRPLAFTFDAPEPVYPMRLTGVTDRPVRVDLFVAGSERAEADGFEVARCARVTADPRHDGDVGHIRVADGRVRDLLAGARVVTRLERTFTPPEMSTDVTVRRTAYAPVQRTVFSERAADALAWNAAALLALGAFVGLASAGSASRGRPSKRRRWPATALVLLLALDAALAIAAFTPTVPTMPRPDDVRGAAR